MKLANEDAASAAGYLLHAFRVLVENPAWVVELAPRIARAVVEHREGCMARKVPAIERAEHIEAAHLAEELDGFCARRIAELQRDLAQYAKRSEGGL